MKKEDEIWKDITGYEGIYQVSSFGNVKRIAKGQRTRIGLILKQGKNTQGYSNVCLFSKGTKKTFTIHKLVSGEFIGDRKGLTVNHKDGNKKNNNVENLEYVTLQENINHAFALGLYCQAGDKNNASVLTEEIVKDIRRLKREGFYYSDIARMLGFEAATVRSAGNGTNWKHIGATL